MAVAIVLLALSGCVSIGRGGRGVEVARPASANALGCALETSVFLGYQPQSGGVADGFVTLMRHRDRSGGNLAADVGLIFLTWGLVRLDWTEWDALRVVGAGSSLNVQAWSLDDDGGPGRVTDEGDAAVQSILDRCT